MNRTQKLLGFTLLLIVIAVVVIVVADHAPASFASVGWHGGDQIASVGWLGRG